MRLLQRDRHQRDDLSAYVDGQLDPRKRRTLEGHLAECASCRQELEELRTVVGLLQRIPQVESPRSFTLAEAPTMAPAWTVRYTAPLRYATATAALLLVAVVTGDLVMSPRASEHTQTSVTELEQDTGLRGAEAPAMELAAPDEMPAPVPEAAAETRAADGDASGEMERDLLLDQLYPTNILWRWAEAVLGLLVVMLAAVAAVQWRTARRFRAG